MERDAFLALASIIWADGVVLEPEAVAMRAAARACGLAGDDLKAVERAIAHPVPLDDLALGPLDDADGALLYGIARWLAAVDGTVYELELEAVEAMADRLALSDAVRQAGARASLNIAHLALAHGGGGAVLDLLKRIEARDVSHH